MNCMLNVKIQKKLCLTVVGKMLLNNTLIKVNHEVIKMKNANVTNCSDLHKMLNYFSNVKVLLMTIVLKLMQIIMEILIDSRQLLKNVKNKQRVN